MRIGVAIVCACAVAACNKKAPQKAAPRAVDVPGWVCERDDGDCKCYRKDARTPPPPKATASGCGEDGLGSCIAYTGMGERGPNECTCLAERTRVDDKGATYVRTYKMSDGGEWVSQCPPLPK